MTVTPDILRAGLVRRGMPAHVADGFVLNFQDESGLNPAINEIAPLVPGSRGGFGLAQWTGPRRVALEQFAAQRGVPASDVDAQLDFLMTELQGPESRAAGSIFAAPDTSAAAVAIARDFLRPAPENLARRSAEYSGGAAPRDRQAPEAVNRLADAYRTGRMTPEDAALYERGIAEGVFPKVERKAESQPDPLLAYEATAMRAPDPVQLRKINAAPVANPLQRYPGL